MTLIATTAFSWILLPFVTVAGFIFPGYLLTRLVPTASVALSSFLGSILVLFWIVLGNQFAGNPLDLPHIAGSLGLVSLGLTALVVWQKSTSPRRPLVSDTIPSLRADHLLYASAASLGLASIIVRAAVDPLSGYDNIFRWNALSLEMLKTGSLDYYPAVSSEAFAHYSWCDGMAPLVSSLNFWLYLGTGSTAPIMTVARIALESGLLFLGVFQFARVLWGSRAAGWAAMGMLATSSLALWAVAMGQETGLTALTLVTMLYFLHTYAQSRRSFELIWAGAAAAAGALSREYGLSYIIIGTLILLFQKARRQNIFTFLAVATALPIPWYLRNAWITGNPLYSMDMLGLFPVNKIHMAMMAAIIRNCSLSSQPENLRYLLILPLVFMGAILLGAVGGIYRLKTKSSPLLLAGLVIGALWLWSVGQTAGGWVYSMRVLSPLVAIAAILAGHIALVPLRTGIACAVAVLAISADAARRSWHLPTHVLTNPWSVSFAAWSDTKETVERPSAPKFWAYLCTVAGTKGIIVEHPGNHILVRLHGGQAVPLFSPRADCLFDLRQTLPAIIAELKERNIRFVILAEKSPITDDFNNRYPFLRELRQSNFKVFNLGDIIAIYDVDMIATLLGQSSAEPSQTRQHVHDIH